MTVSRDRPVVVRVENRKVRTPTSQIDADDDSASFIDLELNCVCVL